MSANDFIDACGFIPSSGGAGNFVVSAAVQGYQTPASAGAVNGNVYSYRAESADKSQWEEGFGAYTSSSTTLARTTITANSSGGTTAISFSAAPNVYITAASADLKNASLLSSGTVADARLSGNVPLKSAANNFTATQGVSVAGTNAQTLNLTNTSGVSLVSAGTSGGGGDIMTHHGNGAGTIYLGNSGVTYLNFDGSATYSLGGSANLTVNGISSYGVNGAVGALNTAKVWVNFTGTTGALNAAYNVSSITRNAAGDYTINFANALPDANYSFAVSCLAASLNSLLCSPGRTAAGNQAPTTTSFRFLTYLFSGGALNDSPNVTFQAYR